MTDDDLKHRAEEMLLLGRAQFCAEKAAEAWQAFAVLKDTAAAEKTRSQAVRYDEVHLACGLRLLELYAEYSHVLDVDKPTETPVTPDHGQSAFVAGSKGQAAHAPLLKIRRHDGANRLSSAKHHRINRAAA